MHEFLVGARNLKFGLSLDLHPYFVHADSEASSESADMLQCDKYQNFILFTNL